VTFEPELGQEVFSNSPWHSTPMQHFVESGLGTLGDLVSEGEWGNDPTVNTGALFANEVFALRAYCWCDGEAKGHENGCPPNFEFKCEPPFTARWYKHVGRGNSQERPLTVKEWLLILTACVESLA
jgi:hypothetical protein